MDSPIGDTRAADRRLPYEHMHAADQYLVVFQGGDHMVFADQRRWGRGGDTDLLFHDLIRQSSLAFWEAYLHRNANAKAWLSTGGFATALGTHGTFEAKLVTR